MIVVTVMKFWWYQQSHKILMGAYPLYKFLLHKHIVVLFCCFLFVFFCAWSSCCWQLAAAGDDVAVFVPVPAAVAAAVAAAVLGGGPAVGEVSSKSYLVKFWCRVGLQRHWVNKQMDDQKSLRHLFSFCPCFLDAIHCQIWDGIPLATRCQHSPQSLVMKFWCGLWCVETRIIKQMVDHHICFVSKIWQIATATSLSVPKATF